MKDRIPKYRRRLIRGQEIAYLTLTDSQSGKRRDIWLGLYDSPESRQKYKQLVLEWESTGRRFPIERSDDMTIAELIVLFQQHVDACKDLRDARNFRLASKIVAELYGTNAARAFRPAELRLVREAMVRRDWSRSFVNRQIKRVLAMFRWGASHSFVPGEVHLALTTVESLRKGHSKAREPDPVKPVPDELVDPIIPHLSAPVQALVQLQRLTGARPGELLKLRKGDIQCHNGATVWKAPLAEHKNAHRRHTRWLAFGPQCQKILAPFMSRPDEAYLFSPQEAEKARREAMAEARKKRGTPLNCGNRPGTNVQSVPRRKIGNHYTIGAYEQAIIRGCDKAFPLPKELRRKRVPARGRKTKAKRWETMAEWQQRLGPEKWKPAQSWINEHRWHPHQLRHSAATRIRRELGLEMAQLILGHSSALVTDAVYAERDEKKITEVMAKIG